MENSVILILSRGTTAAIAGTILLLRLGIAIGVSVVLWLVAARLTIWLDMPQIARLSGWLAILFLTEYLLAGFRTLLQSWQDYKNLALLDSITAVAKIFFSVMYLLWLDGGVPGLLAACSAASFYGSVFAFVKLPVRVLPVWERQVLSEIWQTGRPLQINKILAFVFERSDVIMLAAFSGSAATAIYEIGRKIPAKFVALFGAFKSVFLPHLAEFCTRGQRRAAFDLLRHALRLVAFVSAFSTLLVWLHHDRIVILLFSEKYAGSGRVLAILMLGLSIGLCNYLLGLALLAERRASAVLASSVPESGSNIAGNFLLIPLLGAAGAAMASLLSRTLVNPILLWQRPRPQRLLLLRAYAKSLLPLLLFLPLAGAPAVAAGFSEWVLIAGFLLCCFGTGAIRLADLRACKQTFAAAGIWGVFHKKKLQLKIDSLTP